MNAEQELVSFDTLAESGRLQESGMPGKQADATVNVIARVVSGLVTRENLDDRIDRLETKVDDRFKMLENKIDTRFEKLESSIDTRFEKLESSIDTRFEKVASRFENLETRMNAKIDLVFHKTKVYVVTSQIAVVSLLYAALRFTL